MKKLLLIFLLTSIPAFGQYPKRCSSDGNFIHWVSADSQFRCLPATLPITFTAVSNEWLNSYDATTGLFTSAPLPNSGVTAGSYTNTNLTVDAHGIVTAASNGSSSGGAAATVDLINQSAAITSSTIFTPSSSGMFRVEWFAKVTRVATTSSTLGGFSMTWQDGTDSTSMTHNNISENGSSVLSTSGATGNSLTATLSGSYRIWANNTAIQYSFGYASSGATTMQYEIHIRVYGPL